MATTTFATGSAFNPNVAEKGIEREVLKRVIWNRLSSKREDALIQVKDDLASSGGDTLVFGQARQLTGGLKKNDEPLSGNERSITTYDDSVVLGVVKDAVANDEFMSQQRTKFELRELGRQLLADLVTRSLEESFFNQIAGAEYVTDQTLIGMQASVPSTTAAYRITADSADGNDEDVTNTERMTLDLISEAKLVAKTATPQVRPAYIPFLNREMYVCFVHPEQAFDLRVNDSDWANIWQNALAGGKIEGNPIINGTLGIHDGVLVVESSYVPNGVNSSTQAEVTFCKRAVLCGAQSAVMGWGRIKGNPNRFRWTEERRNHGQIYSVGAAACYGLVRPQFNSADVNSIVIATGYSRSAT